MSMAIHQEDGGRRLKSVALAAGYLAALAFCFAAPTTMAQSYPAKPVTIICGQPAGSGPDIMARVFAEVMSRNMGQRVLVSNRTGSGGIIAASAVAQAVPDGYTLLLVLSNTHTTVPAMQSMPFDPIKDFEFISLLYSSSAVMLVAAKSPVRSVGEFIAFAREKPGGVNYGFPAIGSPAHIMGAMLGESLGVPMTLIGYRGGPQILLDLAGGRIDVTFTSPLQALPHIAQGQFRPLAIASSERIKQLPEVPTLQELGHSAAAVETWIGIAAPRGTPSDILARVGSELARAAKDPAIVTLAEQSGVQLRVGSREAIQQLLLDNYERLGNAVRRFKIKAE